VVRGTSPWNRLATVEVDRATAVIAFELEGSQDEIASLTERLDEWALGLRPWYWRLAGIKWGFVVLVVVWTIVPIQLLSLLIPYAAPPNPRREAFDLIANAVGVPLFAFLYSAYGLKRWLLPPVVFAIGQGEGRYRQLLWWQRGIGGVLVALAVGLVGSLIWKLIS
jgi:hypothetical protein